MKKFLRDLVLFLLPIIITVYFLDVYISSNLKMSNSFAQGEYPVWNDIIGGKVNSDIVIYGSSRAWVHIDPTIISDSLKMSAYNIGIDGHSFGLQYLRHKLLLRYNTKPKVIIYSIDLFTLNKRVDLYNSEQFLPYMLYNKTIKDATCGFEGFSLGDYELPLIRYYGKTDALKEAFDIITKKKKNLPGRVRGFLGQKRAWNSDFDKAKKQMKSYTAEIDTDYEHRFESFLQECRSEDIKLIFVYTPEYIEGQKFTSNRAEVLKIFSNLASKYAIPFYDYSNDSMSFEKKYYYNTLHLNEAGAEIFTEKLISDLKKSGSLPSH